MRTLDGLFDAYHAQPAFGEQNARLRQIAEWWCGWNLRAVEGSGVGRLVEKLGGVAGDLRRGKKSLLHSKLRSGKNGSGVEARFEVLDGGVDEVLGNGDLLARKCTAGGVEGVADVGEDDDIDGCIVGQGNLAFLTFHKGVGDGSGAVGDEGSEGVDDGLVGGLARDGCEVAVGGGGAWDEEAEDPVVRPGDVTEADVGGGEVRRRGWQ